MYPHTVHGLKSGQDDWLKFRVYKRKWEQEKEKERRDEIDPDIPTTYCIYRIKEDVCLSTAARHFYRQCEPCWLEQSQTLHPSS
jgi:hypothetical protein